MESITEKEGFVPSAKRNQEKAIVPDISGIQCKEFGVSKLVIGSIHGLHRFSASEHINLAQKGYNSSLQYDTQYSLMYIYSSDSRMPVYYRLLPGNIREVKSFKNCFREAGLEKAVIIADKGFYSQTNLEMLLQEELLFILPLRRSNTLISYQDLKENTFKSGDAFFTHEERPIWYKTFEIASPTISTNKPLKAIVYLDEQLRIREEADYLRRIKTHPERYSIQEYHNRKDRFGTIALLTVLEENEEGTYETYKSRMSIEVIFDSMKNVLEADHTYMQNEQTLQGWMFVNHITLQWYQHLYIELKEKKLLKKVSVIDYIQILTDVKKIRINGTWYLNEFTAHTQKLIDKLGVKLI
ncbi:MAG: transposase [Lentimicrobiaceae bacterium]